jgi:hypothetical protein
MHFVSFPVLMRSCSFCVSSIQVFPAPYFPFVFHMIITIFFKMLILFHFVKRVTGRIIELEYWNLEFLNNVNTNKNLGSPPSGIHVGDLSWFWLSCLGPLVLLLPKFKLFGFPFERTWWRLFQKRVVRTKLDIYVFITVHSFLPLNSN